MPAARGTVTSDPHHTDRIACWPLPQRTSPDFLAIVTDDHSFPRQEQRQILGLLTLPRVRFGFAYATSCDNLGMVCRRGGGMNNSTEAAGYLEDFRARGEAIADACTRCGACFQACPMTGPAGLGDADTALIEVGDDVLARR